MGKLPMKQLIYTFKDISIDAIIEKHIELLKNQNQPQRTITNFDKVTCDSSFVAKVETVEGANKPLLSFSIRHTSDRERMKSF